MALHFCCGLAFAIFRCGVGVTGKLILDSSVFYPWVRIDIFFKKDADIIFTVELKKLVLAILDYYMQIPSWVRALSSYSIFCWQMPGGRSLLYCAISWSGYAFKDKM